MDAAIVVVAVVVASVALLWQAWRIGGFDR